MKRRSKGFTLVEIAIVLAIVGLLLYYGLAIVGGLRENAAIKDTQARLAKVQEAIINFAAQELRLPCPANDTTGVEVPLAPGTGSCSPVANGVVPWVTLGLSDEEALDGFARRISYRVSTEIDAPPDPTLWPTTFPGTRGRIAIHSDTPVVPGTCPDPDVNACGVAVLVSHGENGWGALLPSGVRAPDPPGDRERENTDGDDDFVQRGFVQDPTVSGGAFDDIAVWLTPDDILTPLVKSKTINTARGVVYDNINEIKDAIMAETLSEPHCLPAHADGYFLPAINLPPTAEVDPWGNPMRYRRFYEEPIAADTEEDAGGLPVFCIWSGGAANDDPECLVSNNLRTEVYIRQLQGWLGGRHLPPLDCEVEPPPEAELPPTPPPGCPGGPELPGCPEPSTG